MTRKELGVGLINYMWIGEFWCHWSLDQFLEKKQFEVLIGTKTW